MILLDNIIFEIQNNKAGGVKNVWKAVLSAAQSDMKNNYVLLTKTYDGRIHYNNIKAIEDKCYPLLLRRYLDVSIKNIELFHSSYFRVHSSKDVINVLTIHDFVYEKYDSRWLSKFHLKQKKRSISKADAIICVSENTKNDLLYYYPDLYHDKIHVIYNGVDKSIFYPIEQNVNQKYGNYLLSVGSRNVHKNFKFTLKLMTLPFVKDKNLKLVIVGGGYLIKNEQQYITKHNLTDRIIHMDNIDDNELRILYNNAYALIYPSFYEGFGIPPLEAMSAGCPVIVSERSSLPEVVGDGGLYVDCNEPESAKIHIEALSDRDKRKKIINKGYIQSSKFSWDMTGFNTINLYNKLLDQK